MDKLVKFLKFKARDIFIFMAFMIFIYAGGFFKVDKSYINYLSLIAISLFILHLILSYIRIDKILTDTTSWTYDPTSPVPKLLEDTDLKKQIEDSYRLNKARTHEQNLKYQRLIDYITIWTHQIKTPLFSLNLLLEDEEVDILAAKASTFEVEEYLNNLLSYIRLEADSTDYVFEELELDELIKATIRKYSKLVILRQNKIDFKPTAMKITTDKKWLAFILDQLISNANKYTSDGTISFYREGNKLVIADTGIGIRPEDVPRVFDRSFTGYNGRIYKKSTGLGLSLAKMVAENLNIGISLTSEVDQGTKVYLDLSKVK